MSVLRGSRQVMRAGIGMLALLGFGIATPLPVAAQTRMSTSLADVPTYIPAPYHPHASTAVFGTAVYSGSPYSQGAVVRYWH